MQNRQALRREMRARRRKLSAAQQRRASRDVASRLIQFPVFRHARNIALYFANDGEIDPTVILERAPQQGHTCFLPTLAPGPGRTLRFARYRPGDPLISNIYGIPEPDSRKTMVREAWTLDLILMPLVAFDRRGNRLGMGGGYYDRALTRFTRLQEMRRPQLVGLAHDFQDAGMLESAAWDVPLDWIATPGELICARKETRAV